MLNKLVNCASYTFQATLPDARIYNVLVVKRTYEVGPSGELRPRQEQELLFFADEAYEEINQSSLLYPSDIIPYKPVSDIIIAANTYAPEGKPTKTWECGLAIKGEQRLEQRLKIHGPRYWEPKWRFEVPEAASPKRRGFLKWQLSDPEPVNSVPLRYEYAWGGQQRRLFEDGSEDILVCEENPLGTGWIEPELTDHTKPVSAPQLEQVDVPITNYDKAYVPACLGPIMPAWLPRRHLGGTFDQNWIDTKRPSWPEDYSFAYHNAAPKAMQWPGFLRGDEIIQFNNMVAGSSEYTMKFFGTGLLACYGGIEQQMALDTLLLDIRSTKKEDWTISLTWRLVLPADMQESIVLDEVYISHPRYQRALPPFEPDKIAKHLEKEEEFING